MSRKVVFSVDFGSVAPMEPTRLEFYDNFDLKKTYLAANGVDEVAMYIYAWRVEDGLVVGDDFGPGSLASQKATDAYNAYLARLIVDSPE